MRNDLIVRQLAPELKGKKVLEVGCGICSFCNEAAPYASEIYAIDIENKMQYIKKHPNLIFKMMDASKLEFRPMSFDTVVYYNFVFLCHRNLLKPQVRCGLLPPVPR